MSSIGALRADFIRSWGEMGTCWGIDRAMARVHALLLGTAGAITIGEAAKALKSERKRRELEPAIEALERCERAADNVRSDAKDIAVFRNRLGEVLEYLCMANKVAERLPRKINNPAIRALLRCLA